MSGTTRSSLDLDEQLTRLEQMEIDMQSTRQAMSIAVGQFVLNVIGTFTALGAAIITAFKVLGGH